METIASKIAEIFNHDGQIFDSVSGDFDQVCEFWGGFKEYRDGYGTDTYKYTFEDGSVLIVAGACWDFGFKNCFCMLGAGHNDDCLAKGAKK